MFEAISSFYNRIFGPSTSPEPSSEAKQPNTFSRKGLFSGWSITFLFGPRAPEKPLKPLSGNSTPQPSFFQRIFPWFFSTSSTADRSSEDALEEHRVSTTSLSSTHQSRPSLTQPRETETADETVWVDRPSITEGASTVAHPETISLYIDASKEGGMVAIQKQGQKKIETPEKLLLITEDLAKTNSQYKKSPASYLESFNKDANRGFTYTLEASALSTCYATNRGRADQPDTLNEHASNPRVEQAHDVVNTIAKAIFPNDEATDTNARTTLANHLKGISNQALFASPLVAFLNDPPSDGTCLIQGAASNADFSYSITGPREITIKATGIYQDANGNLLMGGIRNDQDQLEARSLGFLKDGYNNSTGEITGTVSLNIIATIGDDGTITALCCTSMETSWNAQSK